MLEVFVGDVIYDVMFVVVLIGIYVLLGFEDVWDVGDMMGVGL